MKAIFAALAAFFKKLFGLGKAEVEAVEQKAKTEAEKAVDAARGVVSAAEADVAKAEGNVVALIQGAEKKL